MAWVIFPIKNLEREQDGWVFRPATGCKTQPVSLHMWGWPVGHASFAQEWMLQGLLPSLRDRSGEREQVCPEETVADTPVVHVLGLSHSFLTPGSNQTSLTDILSITWCLVSRHKCVYL